MKLSYFIRCALVLGLLPATLTWADTSARPNPYAGQQHRVIKSLSDEEVDGYLTGSGLGLSRAAELNGYPGPKHVLELAESLALNDDQRRATTELIETMQQTARHHGAQLVAAEQALDKLFAGGQAEPEQVQRLLRQIYEALRSVREAHLLAHLAEQRLLTQTQIARYQLQRGYTENSHAHHTSP